MDSNRNPTANTSNNSIIILSDSDEKVSDSDSTDYEPEPKRSRVEDSPLPAGSIRTIIRDGTCRIPTPSSNAITVTASRVSGFTESQSISEFDALGHSQQSFEEDPPSDRLDPSRETEQPGPSDDVGSVPNSQPESLPDFSAYNTFPSQVPPTRSRRRRRRRGNGSQNTNTSSRNGNNSTQNHPSGTSSVSYSSTEYFTDDVDPMEIPSDEYLYPPFPTRQRRNAIFVRRDPPPSALNEEDQFFHNEFEVDSVPDVNENPIEDGSSTSEADEELVQSRSEVTQLSPLPEETDNNFADNENMKSDVESEHPELEPTPSVKQLNAPNSEISEKDKKWYCVQCKVKTKPYFHYCVRCFKIRRDWLPPRPASRRLKNRKTHLRNGTPNSLNNSSRATKSSDSTEGEDVVDGGRSGSSSQIQQSLPSSQSINMNEGFLVDENNPTANRLIPHSQAGNVTLMELFAPPAANSLNTSASKSSTEIDSQSQSQSSSSQSQRSLCSQNSWVTVASTQSSPPASQARQSPSSPLPNKTSNSGDTINSALSSQCSICFVRAKDAAFVHNKIAHLYCCYTCADKILKKNGKCPICRERVLRVVKIISV